MIQFFAIATSIPLTMLIFGGAAAADQPSASTFQCGEQTIEVAYIDDALQLVVDDERFELHQVPVASGARYEVPGDPAISFWNRGEHALLDIRGVAYPECVLVQDQAPVFRATGNEPGWVIEIGSEELNVDLYYGAAQIAVPLPTPETGEGLTRYVAEEADLTVTILDRYCTDNMSGMPYPYTVILVHAGEEFNGCGGDPASLLRGGEWAVERIAGAEPIEDSRVTIRFGDDNRVAGGASCNRYMGEYILTGETLSFERLASTMMACAEPVMEQEIRYLELLEDIRRFELDEQGRLVLYSADDEQAIIAHRAEE